MRFLWFGKDCWSFRCSTVPAPLPRVFFIVPQQEEEEEEEAQEQEEARQQVAGRAAGGTGDVCVIRNVFITFNANIVQPKNKHLRIAITCVF